MKMLRIMFILLLIAAASAAVMMWRGAPEVETKTAAVKFVSTPVERLVAVDPSMLKTSEEPAAAESPVQPMEERGDALLFEIEALQNTPFDQEITRPFN